MSSARRAIGAALRERASSLHRRLFAWFMAKSDTMSDRLYGDRKRALLADLTGTVVEIGPGSGANLPYYPAGTRWIGVDTNPHMHPYARRKTTGLRVAAHLITGSASALPLREGSVNAVVSTLVLCSVPDQASTLREVRRVLRPGGRFAFIEHVAAPAGSRLRRAQQIVRPLWRRLGDGCEPDRETWRAIEQAGFARLTYDRFSIDVPLRIVAPHVAGAAMV